MSWRTTALRSVAEVSLGRQRAPEYVEGRTTVPYLRAANVLDGRLDLSDVQRMSVTPTERRLYSLRPGDVLVTEGSGSINSVGASAVWQGEIDGTVCFQNTLLRLRPRQGLDGRFLAWWARSAFASKQFASVATGASIYHLSAERVRSLPITFPSLDEQAKIADFLDGETQRIERLIQLRRHQQELLTERAASRITAAIRGASIPGKRGNSRIDWIGDIPATWDVAPVSSQFDVKLGKQLNPGRVEGSHLKPYLRNVNVQWDNVVVEDLLYMNFPPHEGARYQVRPGDLLICEGGEPGRAAIWQGELDEIYYQKALHRARSRGRSLTRWLFYCLRAASAVDVFTSGGNTTTIAHLTSEQLNSQRFPFPDTEIQAHIVKELDEAAQSDRKLLAVLRRQVALLQERRQAVISTAVEGGIHPSTSSRRLSRRAVTA
nr:restriction endonuclease subunit S [Streptomyces antibioticus]